jgi:predicted nucleotidyltransferase component of viral defense system
LYATKEETLRDCIDTEKPIYDFHVQNWRAHQKFHGHVRDQVYREEFGHSLATVLGAIRYNHGMLPDCGKRVSSDSAALADFITTNLIKEAYTLANELKKVRG